MDIPTGEEIKLARQNRGLTQAELANRADVSQPLIARIESSDVDTTLGTLHTIVSALNETPTTIDAEKVELTLPSALKRARNHAGYTQGELADAVGVSQALISRIEREDVNPRISTLRKLFAEVDPVAATDQESEDTEVGVLDQIEAEFANMKSSVNDRHESSRLGEENTSSEFCNSCDGNLVKYPDCAFCPHCGAKLR